MTSADVVNRAVAMARDAYRCYEYYSRQFTSEEKRGGYLGTFVGLTEAIGVMGCFENLEEEDFAEKCSKVISEMREMERYLAEQEDMVSFEGPYQKGKDEALKRVDYQLYQLRYEQQEEAENVRY